MQKSDSFAAVIRRTTPGIGSRPRGYRESASGTERQCRWVVRTLAVATIIGVMLVSDANALTQSQNVALVPDAGEREDLDGDSPGLVGSDTDDVPCGSASSPGPCSVTVDSPPSSFDDLQSAVDVANGGATIIVEGECEGGVTVIEREGLVIEGIAPESGCPANGPGPGDLVSTVRGGRHVIEVIDSRNVTVQFLNIIDAGNDGLRVQESDDSQIHCNCIGSNRQDGLEVQLGVDHQVTQNLVKENRDDGVRVNESSGNVIADNTLVHNRDDGITLENFSEFNEVSRNGIHENGNDGIDIDDSDNNCVLDNQVSRNGYNPDRHHGIELRGARLNGVDGNTIRDNAGGLFDEIRCQIDSDSNTGSNMTLDCGTTITPQCAGGGTTCVITFRTTTAATFVTLQFETDYADAPGGFVGTGLDVDCASLLPSTGFAFNDLDDASILISLAIDQSGFDGPTDVVACTFAGIFEPTIDDFAITVVDASDPALEPIDGAEVVISEISCVTDATSTTTSTSTSTTTSTTSTTTTLPLGAARCPATPAAGCLHAGKAQIQLLDRDGEFKDAVTWKWRNGDETLPADLGDPTDTTEYVLCVYDSATGVASLATSLAVASGRNWRASGSGTVSYRDRSAASDGVSVVQLKPGVAGKASATLKARGPNVRLPARYDATKWCALEPTMTVQLINGEGRCWSTDFDSAASNTGRRFKAKAP